MQTPQRFCMPFLLLLLSLLHTTGWAGSAGEGKEQTPDPQRCLFVQPNNYNTNGKREDKRTRDQTLGQTSYLSSRNHIPLWFCCVCPCFFPPRGWLPDRNKNFTENTHTHTHKETSVSTSWLVLRRHPYITDLYPPQSPPQNHRKTTATTVTTIDH